MLIFASYCSGNSAVQAISLLLKKGVPEGNIIFLNLISVSRNRFLIVNLLTILFKLILTNDGALTGTTRCACSVQTVSKNKDSNIRDRNGVESRVSCASWDGRIRRQIFWDRWWMNKEVQTPARVILGSWFAKMCFGSGLRRFWVRLRLVTFVLLITWLSRVESWMSWTDIHIIWYSNRLYD